jgi:hypothetical protein
VGEGEKLAALQSAVDRLVAGLGAQHSGGGRGGAEAVEPEPAAAATVRAVGAVTSWRTRRRRARQLP